MYTCIPIYIYINFEKMVVEVLPSRAKERGLRWFIRRGITGEGLPFSMYRQPQIAVSESKAMIL